MKYYFIFDFYLQSDKGLDDLKNESGFESIDPWEDMAEDFDFIKSDFFCHFPFEIVQNTQTQIADNFIARFLVKSHESFDDFILHYKVSLEKLRNNGWALYSKCGRPFIIGSVNFEIGCALLESNKEICHYGNIKHIEFK
jgi:hypothetical protein